MMEGESNAGWSDAKKEHARRRGRRRRATGGGNGQSSPGAKSPSPDGISLVDCSFCVERFEETGPREPASCPHCGGVACRRCFSSRSEGGPKTDGDSSGAKSCPFCGGPLPESLDRNSAMCELYGRRGKVTRIDEKELQLESHAFAQGMSSVLYLAQYRGSRVVVKLFVGLMELEPWMEAVCFMYQSIRHPMVVSLYGVVQLSVGVALVLEYVRHGNLLSWVGKKALDPLVIGMSVAQYLQHLHSIGLYHSGLNLRSVLIADSETTEVKIADFSIASRPWSADTTNLMGSLLSPMFVAVEGLNGERTGKAGDIYSLGILLWCMFTGKTLPYDVDCSVVPIVAMSRVITDIQGGRRPDCTGLDPNVRAILERTWTSSVRERITIDELVMELQRLSAKDPDPKAAVTAAAPDPAEAEEGSGESGLFIRIPSLSFSSSSLSGTPTGSIEAPGKLWAFNSCSAPSASVTIDGARPSPPNGVWGSGSASSSTAMRRISDGGLFFGGGDGDCESENSVPDNPCFASELKEILGTKASVVLKEFLGKVAAHFGRNVDDFFLRPGQYGSPNVVDERELMNCIRCRENWDRYFSHVFKDSHGVHPLLLRVKIFFNVLHHGCRSVETNEALTTELARKRVHELRSFLELLSRLPPQFRVDSGDVCDALADCARRLVIRPVVTKRSTSAPEDESRPCQARRAAADVRSNIGRELHVRGRCRPCRYFFSCPGSKCTTIGCTFCHQMDRTTGQHDESYAVAKNSDGQRRYTSSEEESDANELLALSSRALCIDEPFPMIPEGDEKSSWDVDLLDKMERSSETSQKVSDGSVESDATWRYFGPFQMPGQLWGRPERVIKPSTPELPLEIGVSLFVGGDDGSLFMKNGWEK